MITYYIYNQITDEFLGTVNAANIYDAEYQAYGAFNTNGDGLYALTTAPGEPLA